MYKYSSEQMKTYITSHQHNIELAKIISSSLDAGDHLSVSFQQFRGIFGFASIFIGCFKNQQTHINLSFNSIYVASSVTAHGARMASAIKDALNEKLCVIGDSRLAEETIKVDSDFPSLSFISISRIANFRSLVNAIQLRRLIKNPWRNKSKIYSEYLFIAQALRFRSASKQLSSMKQVPVVLTDFDRCAYSAPWLFHANQLGLKTATFVHGSPNPENYLPLNAKNVLVWGTIQKKWFENKSPSIPVYVVGRPELSGLEAPPSPDAGRLIICHSDETLSLNEINSLKDIIFTFRQTGGQILMRLHPSVKKVPLSGGWSELILLCDTYSFAERSLQETLFANDYVVVITSTAAVDALALNVKVIVLADRSRSLPADLEVLRDQSTNLFQKSELENRTIHISHWADESKNLIKKLVNEWASKSK